MKVLLVDDEPAILTSTMALLEVYGHLVHASSTHHGIPARVREERPDVVLHDVRMPGLDLDVQLAALQDDPATGGIPIVLFSADLDSIEPRHRERVDGILEKPFRIDQLLRALQAAADSRRERPSGASTTPLAV